MRHKTTENGLSQAETQYKKMTETPVPKLVLGLGLPTTISMLVTSIYSMADSYFVSQLGDSQSGAVGIVFALMAIIQAFGFMFGHGAGSNIGRLLGRHELEEAKKYSATSFWMGIVSGVLITVLGLSFWDPFMYLLGSTDTILPYAKQYSLYLLLAAPFMVISCIMKGAARRRYSLYLLLAAPFMVISCIMNNILRYEGKATFSMIGLGAGGILNIFGDFLLINVFKMGVTGAGISTGVSQCISCAILLVPFLRGKVQSSFHPKYIAFNGKLIFSILSIGFPSMMRQGLNSISAMILNKSCGVYGDATIAAMSIVSRVMGFLFCVGLGIGQGFQPVCGFNYGAGKYKRVRQSFWFTVAFGTCMLAIMGAFGFIFAPTIISWFRDKEDVIAVGARALRFQSISLLFVGFTVCGNMLFQSIGKSGRAIFLASARSGLFFIPIILIMRSACGLTGIEISQAIADVLAAVATLPIVLNFFKKLPKEDVRQSE